MAIKYLFFNLYPPSLNMFEIRTMLFMWNKKKIKILSHLCNIRDQSSSFLFKHKNIVFLMICWNFLGLETPSNFEIFK